MRPFGYTRATDANQALAETAEGSAWVAGGTTLIDLIKLEVLQPDRLIDLNRAGMAEIAAADGGLRIGAMVRNSDLARDERVRRLYPAMAEALLSGASAQIRNLATTAGNVLQRTRCPYYRDAISRCNKRRPGDGCAAWDGYNRSHAVLGGSEHCIATHPSDFCVALAAFDATVEIEAAAGPRRVPFAEFHLLPGDRPDREFALAPGELIASIFVPALAPGTRSWYLKLRDRESYEFALASTAVVLRLEGGRMADARVALGGVATKPWRAVEAEALLRGEQPGEAVFQRAANAALSAARGREHNGFKIELARRAIVRGLQIAAAGQPAPRQV